MKTLLAALAFTIAVPASAGTFGPYTDLVIFGDSLSDSGNAAAISVAYGLDFNYVDYPLGQFTNGQTWASQLGTTPSLLGGTNFAVGGARAVDNGDLLPDLGAQIQSFTAAPPALGSNPLAAIWIGGNDFRDYAAAGGGDAASTALFVGGIIAEISQAVITIASTGIHDVVVFGLPDLGKLPDFVGTALGGAITQVVTGYNAALDGTTQTLNAGLAGTNVGYFDVNSFFLTLLGPDNGVGITNWTQACLDVPVACAANPDSFVFWDDIHPTEGVHKIVAKNFTASVSEVPLPAGLPLLIGGLAAFGLVSRRRRSRA